MVFQIDNQINHYVFALYSIYEENDESFIKDLKLLFKTLNIDKKIISILSSSNIDKIERKQIVDNIYKNKINDLLLNFLYILIDNNFIQNVFFILKSFFAYYNKQNNILYVKISSAHQMSDEQIKRVLHTIDNTNKKEIEYSIEIDESLIGGFKITINHNNVIDYSIKGKLDNIRKNIANNKGDI